MGNWIGSGPAQRLIVLGPYCRILFFQPFLVGDRLLLHIFDIEWPTEAILLLEDMRWLLAAQDATE